MSEYMNVEDVEEFTRRALWSARLKYLASIGEIVAYNVEGTLLFKREDIVAYIEKQKVTGQEKDNEPTDH